MERKLQFNCPTCKHKLAKVHGMNVATQVVKRSCSKCKSRWQLIVKPKEIHTGQGFIDVAEFVKIN